MTTPPSDPHDAHSRDMHSRDMPPRDMRVPEGPPTQGMTTEEKRMLLRKLLRSKIDLVSEPFPLTLGQRALWFLQQFVPDSTAYNIPVGVRCTPPLDLTVLRAALDAVVARHPALRFQFSDQDGTPRQQAMPAAPVPLEVYEAPASEAALQQQVLAEIHRPFALDGSLLRVAVWRGADFDVLMMTMHHLVFDGRSIGVLLYDLGAFYRAVRDGVPHTLGPLPANYRDFVLAEQQLLETDNPNAARLWSYWEKQFNGPWEDLSLPSLRPRPAKMSLRGDSIPLDLTYEQVDRIKAVAKTQRATLYAAIYTLVQAVLYQFTGQPDLVIGMPASARSRSEWNTVLGYFVNTLPIRAPLATDRTFAEQLRLVHDQVLGALAHQEFPFAGMVERLKVTRDPARTPIFQTIVNVMAANQRATSDGQSAPENLFGDSQAEPYIIPNLEGQFDVAVEMLESPTGWTGFFKYSVDALDAGTATRMRNSFYTMLDLALEHPDWTIETLVAYSAQQSSPSIAVEEDDADREDFSF